MTRQKRAIVVGAGIAGLSAGHDLQKAGVAVTVLDAARFAGGRMADIRVKSMNLHSGASIAWRFFKEMMGLIDELGLGREIVPWPDDVRTVDDGAGKYPIKYRIDLPFIATHPRLSFASKAKLARMLPDMIRAGLTTDPCLMHTAVAFDDESIATYVERLVGKDFLEQYIEPLFRGPWNWEPEDISRAYLLPILGHLVGSEAFTFREGIGQLSRELAARLDVRLGASVTAIRTVGDGARVEYHDDDGTHTESADYVVCAVQGTRVAGIVPVLEEVDRQFFDGVRYTPNGIVYYVLDRAPAESDLWFARSHPSLFAIYSQIPSDPLVPPGQAQPPHLYCELTPEANRDAIRRGLQRDLDSIARDQARRFYPDLDEHLVEVVEQWWDEMLPEWYPGYARQVAAFISRQEASPRRIYMAGDYLSHSHTGGACASGRRTARLALAHHGAG